MSKLTKFKILTKYQQPGALFIKILVKYLI